MDSVNILEELLERENVFLSGGAGVGKSYLTNALKLRFKEKGKKVAVLGSTAISAFNVGGVTFHSFLALGICSDLSQLVALDKRQKDKLEKLKKTLKKLDLIIIDEISMISADLFELFAYRLRSLNYEGRVLVVGDFFQLPPVLKKEASTQNVSLWGKGKYAFDALSWGDFAFKNVLLSKPKRTSNALFIKHLSALRQAELTQESLEYFESFLLKGVNVAHFDESFTLLCGINKKVDLINETKLAGLKSEIKIFKATKIKLDESLEDRSFEAWIRSLNLSEELKLKIGAKIIFCVNNYDAGYFNGEQGIISGFEETEGKEFIEVTKSNGAKIMLEPFKFTFEDFSQESKVLGSFSQFPIKLAYAMTIHKSQGMSIEKLICDVDNIFENGQLYVALSRSSEPNFLKLSYSRARDFKEHFLKAIKFDERIIGFYQNESFLDLEKPLL